MVELCLAEWICANEVEEFYFPSLVGLLPAMDRERKEEQRLVCLDFHGYRDAEHRGETLSL